MQNKKGFTLIEVLLVVAAIAILAGIVILAINPTKQLADARDTQRQADVNTILNAVYQYAIDNDGTLPSGINSTATEICASDAEACASLVNLGVLTTNEQYLTAIPEDPAATGDGVGYEISQSANGRVTVSAPDAENTTISATR